MVVSAYPSYIKLGTGMLFLATRLRSGAVSLIKLFGDAVPQYFLASLTLNPGLWALMEAFISEIRCSLALGLLLVLTWKLDSVGISFGQVLGVLALPQPT